MKLSLEINMDNDAFDSETVNGSEWAAETISCLQKVIAQLQQERQWGKIHDTNGNTVGCWDIDYQDEEEMI